MAQRLSSQELAWEWVDGVCIATMEDIPPEERNDLEAYGVARLKQAPEYVCRVTGCKRAMRRAIERASACTEDWVLIMQDDAEPVDSLDLKLKELFRRIPDGAACIMLHHGKRGMEERDGWMRVTGDVRSMTAFALRPSFAPVMSQALRHWGGEADRIWGRLVRNGAFILSAEPMLVSCSQKGSDIIGGIPELKKFWE